MTLATRRPAARLRAGLPLASRPGSAPSTARAARSRRVVDALAGLPLNSPNDVVVKRDGTIWFTDPSYGFLQGFRPRAARTATTSTATTPHSGRLTVVAATFDKPNGLAFSPDERVLYVGDSGANHEPGSFDPRRPHHIRAFDVVEGRRLASGRALRGTIAPGFPDGIKVDATAASTPPPSAACRSSIRRATCSARSTCPGAVNFTFGGARSQRPLHHHRRGRLGRRPQRERSVTAMAVVRTRRIIDDEGADAVIDAALAFADDSGPPRRRSPSSTSPAS